jgi:hypothetical protein
MGVIEHHWSTSGFSVAQERYRALLCMKNLPAIETWRAGLDDAQRRRLNHPNAIWARWKRSTRADGNRSAPAQHFVKSAMPSHRNGRPIYFGQDILRRAAMALRETRSNDTFVVARAVLEAAIRSENDLIELPSPDTAAMSALPPRAAVVSVAGHVR